MGDRFTLIPFHFTPANNVERRSEEEDCVIFFTQQKAHVHSKMHMNRRLPNAGTCVVHFQNSTRDQFNVNYFLKDKIAQGNLRNVGTFFCSEDKLGRGSYFQITWSLLP